MERIDNLVAIVAEHSNFGDPGGSLDSAGRFNINDTVHALKLRQRDDIFINAMPAKTVHSSPAESHEAFV